MGCMVSQEGSTPSTNPRAVAEQKFSRHELSANGSKGASAHGTTPKGDTPMEGMLSSREASMRTGTVSVSKVSMMNFPQAPQIINGFQVYSHIDYNKCRVKSVISSKTKLDSVLRFLDTSRKVREHWGYFPNPEEPASPVDTRTNNDSSTSTRGGGRYESNSSLSQSRVDGSLNVSVAVHNPGVSMNDLMMSSVQGQSRDMRGMPASTPRTMAEIPLSPGSPRSPKDNPDKDVSGTNPPGMVETSSSASPM
jgi:hypothetical protein